MAEGTDGTNELDDMGPYWAVARGRARKGGADSGHKNVRMLLRYTHGQPAQLASKLSILVLRG
jgi:hypothetical protein